jgi:hypothetical protein
LEWKKCGIAASGGRKSSGGTALATAGIAIGKVKNAKWKLLDGKIVSDLEGRTTVGCKDLLI